MSNIRNVTFSALMNSVNGLTSNASTLKYAIFRSRMKIEDLNPSSISDYLNKLHSYLTFWEDVSDDLDNAMKTAEGHENVYAISYESIKDVINFHNDYAAVLPFADGIIKGVTGARMTTPDDIEDFAMHTVRKAFNGSSCEPASYLDDIRRLIDRAGRSKSSSLDAKMFNAVAKQRLFDPSDIRELSRAAQKTIDFLVHNLDSMAFKTNFTFEASGVKLFAAAINRIVDFITYSATVYASRVYVICEYASPYITGDETAYESSGHEDNMSIDSPCAPEVTVLKDADDFILRNPENTKDLNEILDIFISRIGAPDQSGVHQYAIPKQDSDIVKALARNDLQKFLTNTPIGETNLERSLLEELTIDPKHPINQGKTSAKNELLYIIKGMKLEPTVKACRNMAVDLRNYAIMVSQRIHYRITCLSDNSGSQTLQNHDTKLADMKQNSECIKMYIDLYHDIVGCLLQKGRDIENKYNQLNKAETSRLISQFSLKLPGEDECDTNHTMMTAIPDTTRTPVMLTEAYALPMFEEMQMYDSYLRALPEFYGDEYLSEALDISALWNKLLALIAAAGKRLRAFVSDAKTTRSLDWVSKNERLLLSLTFPNPAQMSDITRFKDRVGKPQGFDNLANGLRRFTMKDIETPEALEKFIKSLYPSEQVYNFWETKTNDSQTADNTKAKNNMDVGSAKYRNLILFTDNVASVTTEDPAHVTLKDNELRKELASWVATIKSVGGALKDAQSIDRDLQDAVRSIKQKLNSAPSPSTNNQSTQPDTKNTSGTANGSAQLQNASGKKGAGDIPANQSTSGGSGSAASGDLRNVLLTNIITAQSRIYEGLINALIEYIRTTYAMIQRAYGLGKKPE